MESTVIRRELLPVGVRLAFSSLLVAGPSGTADAQPAGPTPRVIDITACGAKGDGVADDSPALRAAFKAAEEANVRYVMVYAPPGNYRLTGWHLR